MSWLFTQLSTLNPQLSATQRLIIRVRATASARRGSANASVWLASASLDSRVGNSPGCSPINSQPQTLISLPRFVPIANQTGFHATTAVKARRPCSRIGSSLPLGQTGGQDGVLQRAMFVTGGEPCGGDRRYPFVGSHHVAACSARLQSSFRTTRYTEATPKHQHHKASTNSARKETAHLRLRFLSSSLGVRKPMNSLLIHSIRFLAPLISIGTFDFSAPFFFSFFILIQMDPRVVRFYYL